ncbi:MAG: hypothetical protein ABI873_06635 [Marmoricola sp.]
MTARLVPAVAGTAVVLLLASGCGSGKASGKESDKGLSKAADGTTCVADARSVAGNLPSGFPAKFPFPSGSVVYHAEDRGKDGVIVSAITSSPFKDVLAALNGPAQKAGFKVTSGETDKHDAEADWSGKGYRGRWAIKESATCKGEVAIQVLAAKG